MLVKMGDGVGDCTMADGLEIETLKVPWLKSGKIQLQHLNGKNQCFVHGHLLPAMSTPSCSDTTGWLLE